MLSDLVNLTPALRLDMYILYFSDLLPPPPHPYPKEKIRLHVIMVISLFLKKKHNFFRLRKLSQFSVCFVYFVHILHIFSITTNIFLALCQDRTKAIVMTVINFLKPVSCSSLIGYWSNHKLRTKINRTQMHFRDRNLVQSNFGQRTRIVKSDLVYLQGNFLISVQLLYVKKIMIISWLERSLNFHGPATRIGLFCILAH